MNATQLLKHFDRLAEAPNAVPRLRRFILDLAVRGKLVEQDAGDEPAAELLKRIHAERARLVKAGKLKRVAEEKADESEFQFVLPDQWVWSQLGKVAQYGIPDRAESNEVLPLNTWVLDLEDIEKNTSRVLAHVESEARPFSSTKTVFKQGDVLFGKLRPYLNKVIVADRDGVCTTEIIPIRGYCGLVPEYTQLVLRSPLTMVRVDRLMYGMKMPRLGTTDATALSYPLPPLAEQHRIVAKVDELMALCDQLEAAQQERESRRDRLAAASLQRLNQPAADTIPEAQREHARFHLHHLPRITIRPEHIKAIRQLLVNLAVVGKLAKSESNDEPAEVLLKKVWAEKKSRGLLTPAKESGKGNVGLTTNNLPAGWACTTFESFATEIATGPFGSALHQSDYIDGGIPLVNPSHMIGGRIIANPKISVTDETANGLASYRMKSGDVVMARRGEVGRAAIVTDAEAGWLCGTGSFFVSFHQEIDRQFVILLLRSDAVRRYLAGAAIGTTMVNLNHGILKRIPLALPPAAEQHRIVAKVDELMTLCDQLEAQLTTTQTDSRRLLEAVLEAALVPA